MTIAHMQGKFQLEMSYHTSHHIHEDDPARIAAIITRMQARYKFGTPLKIPYAKFGTQTSQHSASAQG